MTDAIRGAVSMLTALGILLVLAGYFGHAHPAFDSLAALRIQFAVGFACVLLFSVAFAALTARLLAVTGLLIAGAGIAPAAFPGDPVAQPQLSVYSHNLRFDNGAPDELLAQIAAAAPDVVVLQEIGAPNEDIVQRLARRYRNQVVCPFASVGGVAILTNARLLDKPGCLEGQGAAWVRLGTDGGPLTVVGLHLHWPWPYGQPEQITSIAPELSALDEPVLIAGDFNAPSWSHAVDRIAAATGTRPASGLRLTFRRPGVWPGLPLDHMLLSEDLSGQVAMLPAAGSDHMALLGRIAFRNRTLAN
ncbi:endonuclease/exonuclease/phosphatase family protein [Halovulum sp. GXIMD14794]